MIIRKSREELQKMRRSGRILAGTIDGAQLRTMLDAGQLYVNVHTAANGGGEIRGQIAKQ